MPPTDVETSETESSGLGIDQSTENDALGWIVDRRPMRLPGKDWGLIYELNMLQDLLKRLWPAQYKSKWKNVLAGHWPEDTGWQALLIAEPRPEQKYEHSLYRLKSQTDPGHRIAHLLKLQPSDGAISHGEYEIAGCLSFEWGLDTRGFTLERLCSIYQQLAYPDVYGHYQMIIWRFLFRYIGTWVPERPSKDLHQTLSFQIRIIKVSDESAWSQQEIDPKHPRKQSIFPERDRGACFYAGVNQQGGAMFEETRAAIMLRQDNSSPCYSVVYLLDDVSLLGDLPGLYPEWKINFDVLARLSIFLVCFERILGYACKTWHKVIDHVGEQVSVPFSTVVNMKEREALLFDDENFSKSKQYFAGLQLLRVCMLWISETQRDFDDVLRRSSDFFNYYSMERSETTANEPSREDIKHEKESLPDRLHRISTEYTAELEWLLEQARTQRETIISLRDGLFTATSIREARMGYDVAQESKRLTAQSTELANISTGLAKSNTRMSRLVLIFTVMTILYLPLSFVTGFFGMNNLEKNWPGVLANMWPFGVILAITALVTYAAAGWGYYHIIVHGEKEMDPVNKNP